MKSQLSQKKDLSTSEISQIKESSGRKKKKGFKGLSEPSEKKTKEISNEEETM